MAILNLSAGEFAAVGVTSVEDALAVLRGIRPDLVLLDAMMPGVVGLEHALEMRDDFGCRVLLMSGASETTGRLEELVRAGHIQFEILPKPIPPRELMDKVREMLAQPLQTTCKSRLQFRVQGASS